MRGVCGSISTRYLYLVKTERLVALARAGKIKGKLYHSIDWYIEPHQDIPKGFTKGFEI